MSVNVTSRRNSAGEVSIAGTIPNNNPTGYTLPVGATPNGDGTCSLDVNVVGGGVGNVVITGTTPTGNTNSTSSNLSTGGPTTIAAGALSIEFLLSSDFQGTINGATFNNTGTIVVGVFRLDAPPWKPLAALTYTITAGTAILTVQT